MGEILLEVNHLSKRFSRDPGQALRYAMSDVWREFRRRPASTELRRHEFWALQDVSFTMNRGEVLGIIGHNGAGKSTLINLLAGLMLPTEGEIRLHTDRIALMDHNGGLSMAETGRENIVLQLTLHRCQEARIAEETEAVMAFAELGEFIDAPVGTYSLGMRLRLAFSIYTRLEPDLFIVDEALSGGDLRFQQKFRTYLRSYIDNGGAILLCSHDLFVIQTFCQNCLLLDRGHILARGEPAPVIQAYHQIMQKPAETIPGQEIEVHRTEAKENSLIATAVLSAPRSVNPDDFLRNSPSEANHLSETEDEATDREESTLVGNDINHPSKNTPASIRSVTICASADNKILPGDGVNVEIVCQTTEPFPSVLAVVEIGCGDLTTLATIVGGYEEEYSLTLGTHVFRCQVDHLPLPPGQYTLRTIVSDRTTGVAIAWKGYVDAPDYFEVASQDDPYSSVMVFRKNLVYIAAKWQQNKLAEH